jgi:hypothetical protein
MRRMAWYSRLDIPQLIKWTVYVLLLVNWGLYAIDEWSRAEYTLRSGGSLLDWTTAFGTTLDEAAWFGLLFIWELETYVLDEHSWNRALEYVLLGLRGVCYVFLAHTVLVWGISFADLVQMEPDPELSGLCQLADQDISYAYNLDYTLIDSGNCNGFDDAAPWYRVDNSAITGAKGMQVEIRSAWVDLQDAIVWLLVMFTIEIAIWLQDRNITGGPVMAISHFGKFLYAVLFFDAAYWAWHGHWLYCYDQLLWIFGFWAIEYNMKQWADEIRKSELESTPT